ncbi:hypothetical protein D9M71_832920 [compost metagenome]
MPRIQVVDDGQGLGQDDAGIVHQDRYPAHRIQLSMLGAELLAGAQVDAVVVRHQPLEGQGDAHAVGGGAVEETVELHGKGSAGFR